MKTRTQSIQDFLKAQLVKVDLYNPGLEVQVMSTADKPFRIPYKDGNYEDSIIETFQPDAIGLTGWNWFEKKSYWVGFDFDSITNHEKGLTDWQLDEIRDKVKEVSWITMYRSKSGKGFHLYVFFDDPPDTANRAEHAALARSILSNLSVLLSFDFNARVDTVGGVLWIWHKDTKQFGLTLVKQGDKLKEIPKNWREHIGKTKSKRYKTGGTDGLDNLIDKTKRIILDDEHKRIITAIANSGNTWWWDDDLGLLVTHTKVLEEVHIANNLLGIYKTKATGRDLPRDYNCFAFPIHNGGFIVRRFGINCSEDPSWYLDQNGWRTIYYNVLPDLGTAARINFGVKTEKGSYNFSEWKNAKKALALLGQDVLIKDVDDGEEVNFNNRSAVLTPGKLEGEVIVSIEASDKDPILDNWYREKDKWKQVIQVQTQVSIIQPPDELVRSTAYQGIDYGWFIYSKSSWIRHPKSNVAQTLLALGYKKNDIDKVIGQAVLNHWSIVNLPFREEYPGDRQWNKEGAQLTVTPKQGQHPTWDSILNHTGQGLPKDYLLQWIASMFQFPYEPLPYLFFFGEQNSGKSILHEALHLLMSKGYVRADSALKSNNNFNGELLGAILCIVEETNLKQDTQAYARIKDWVTGKTISIHAKGDTPYILPNTTHWIQCDNRPTACPVFAGDTRITVARVPAVSNEIPKHELLERLRNEAQAFLWTVLNLTLPNPVGRLRLPCINSEIKDELIESNKSLFEIYMQENLIHHPGAIVKFDTVYDDFISKIGKDYNLWSKIRVGREIIGHFVKGRWGGTGAVFVGNCEIKDKPFHKDDPQPYIIRDGRLTKNYDSRTTS